MGGKTGGKKSLKANVATLSTSFLRFLNMLLVAGALGTIVLMFIVNPSPTGSGWGYIVMGIMVILSGAFGTISSGQIGCFGCHMIFLVISALGLVAGFLTIFLKFDSVMYNLWPQIYIYDAKQYVRACGATYFVLFSTQLVILLLACMIQVCGFLEYYEDLDAIVNARHVAQMHQEDENRRTRVAALTTNPLSAHPSGSSSKLVEKMKAKYSQWTKKDPIADYDMENAQLGEPGGSNSHTFTS